MAESGSWKNVTIYTDGGCDGNPGLGGCPHSPGTEPAQATGPVRALSGSAGHLEELAAGEGANGTNTSSAWPLPATPGLGTVQAPA
jgi:hypothetical protein